MTTRSVPVDTVLRAAFWSDARVLGLDAPARLAFLWLVAVADADGIAPVDAAAVAAAAGVDDAAGALARIERAALAATYPGGGALWAWVPRVPRHQPAGGRLRRAREPARPAPDPAVVAAVLRARGGAEPTRAECRDACPRAFGRRRRATGGPPAADVAAVWDAWRRRQADPDACAPSAVVQELIRGALRVTDAARLVALVGFAYDADHEAARFWRGQNGRGRTYLGLDNLLVASKLPGRLQMVAEHAARAAAGAPDAAAPPGDAPRPPPYERVRRWREGRADGKP